MLKKYFFLKIALLVCAVFAIAFNNYAQGFLKAKEKIIVNEKGSKVILRGMGLGGWMLQEGYMFRVSNLGQQYRIKEKIKELVGTERTEQFYNDWLINHTSKADVDSLGAWGFNSIRLPMHYNLFTLPVDEEPVKGENTWLQTGFRITDSLLVWCKKNKIYLILDMHATPGGQGNDLPISDRDAAKPSLWQSEDNRKKLIALWRKLAEHYAAEEWIGGYDIINEPNWGFEDEKDSRGISEKSNVPLKKLMVDITNAIREADKKHIIIIEGNGFGNNYQGLLPTWDNNTVLSFHKYGNFNTTPAIQKFLDLREKYNVPIWLGESGENSNTWFTEAIQLAEQNEIGWAWWQGKKMGINNPLEIKLPEGYDRLLAYWSGKSSKPPSDSVWAILQQLLQNIKIQNNINHPDVIDAMFRQVNSIETMPFKNHTLNKKLVINAIDFDLGRQRFAYYDKDTASYQYTQGVNTRGNRGRTYRNDGVDITAGKEGPYIFSIEDGEWMQYTINVKKPGKFNVSFTVLADSTQGKISLLNGNTILIKEMIINKDDQVWQVTEPQIIYLNKGINKLRVLANKGGFNLVRIIIKQE